MIQKHPKTIALHIQLSAYYTYRHEHDRALACLDEALKVDPDSAAVKFEKGYLLLLKGDYENGWPLHEFSFPALQQSYPFNPGILKRQFLMDMLPPRPQWVGQDLKGKKLLVWTTQGSGDNIMMIRYIPLLAGKAESIYVLADGGLAELFSQGWPGVQIFRQPQDIPDFHFQCNTHSLPNAFQTRLETIPNRVPYLLVEPKPVKATKQRKVGLCWKGNPYYANDKVRSLDFKLFHPLLDVGARFINLQLDVKVSGLDNPVIGSKSFYETAQIVMGCDLVISVDTSIAHLAGLWAARCGC